MAISSAQPSPPESPAMLRPVSGAIEQPPAMFPRVMAPSSSAPPARKAPPEQPPTPHQRRRLERGLARMRPRGVFMVSGRVVKAALGDTYTTDAGGGGTAYARSSGLPPDVFSLGRGGRLAR